MSDFTDPRPHLPQFDCKVIVKCSDGSTREACLTNTWDGPQWRHWPGGMCDGWSMACPKIEGWKYA